MYIRRDKLVSQIPQQHPYLKAPISKFSSFPHAHGIGSTHHCPHATRFPSPILHQLTTPLFHILLLAAISLTLLHYFFFHYH
ncbi:unnamed protein product [Rodentolepis nana]|uniref:Ovule protein n=1 Tax=Rodentolepis nana TaxID=102285 RepID=A0A0R3TH45_RODNA|nr:unnamed protein product [Rodentolepis nana]